jgi:4-amino-4-deoxy-L-arabinose transferase-like glycosyltransferase
MRAIREFKSLAVVFVILPFLYFLSRLPNLTNLPIFTDEAIYIRWSQIAEQDASWRFISLTDGKQPMLIWATMITLKLFSDPLFAGRVVSVISGFVAMIGIGLLGRELFKNNKIGILSSVLYLISPFSLMYDRMALMDSMLAMFSIWSLYFAILLVRRIRFDIALVFGMLLGGAILTKTSGFFSIYLLPATILLFDFKHKERKQRLLKWILYVSVAVIMSQLYYGVLRLSPWFHMISEKDTTFIFSFSRWIQKPFEFFAGNLHGLSDWALGYLTIPFVVLMFISLLFFYKSWREKLLLIILFLVPFVGLAFFGKVLYPRFILFMVMPLIVLASWGLWFLVEKIKLSHFSSSFQLGIILLFIAYPVYIDSKIIFSIVTAPIPKADSGQYINDHPAGWGIREANDFFFKESQKNKITIYTEGTFGLLPYGLEIDLVNNPNIKIIGVWPVPDIMSNEMIESIESMPTYYVSNKFQELPREWEAELLTKYQKGNNMNSFLQIYKLAVNKEH